MKIAIIRKKYSYHGGAEGFSNSLIQNLANNGHEVHIFAIKWQADNTHKNIFFHEVPAITFISFLRDLTFAISSFFILKNQRDNFDIIQTHDKTLYQDIYRAGDGCHIEWLRQRWKRIGAAGKLSIALNPWHWLILFLERLIMKGHKFKKILAISEMVKNNIVENYAVNPAHIDVIYNGVDIKKFHPGNREKYRNEIRKRHGISENEFVVLFVGSGFERKGVKYLIEAIELIEERVTLMIVGKGSEKRFKRKTAKQKIVFCGPRKDIDKYYASAEIFVFPTIYEPFGNVQLEAFASGLPVITTKNSGAAEIIKEGKEGFVLDIPEDLGAIAEKIRICLDDRDKLESMSSKARELAEGFTFEKYMDRIGVLYESIMNNSVKEIK